MKRFITLSLLIVTAVLGTMACINLGRPNYYMFSLFNRMQMGRTFDTRLQQYWEKYTGTRLREYQVSALASADLDDAAHSDNPIVKKLSDDAEMMRYVRLLQQYLQGCRALSNDSWNYPSKEQIDGARLTMEQVGQQAQAYGGTRLKPQYALLYVRTLVALDKWAQVGSYWESTARKLPESVFKDMMRNTYAGSLLRQGRKQEACRIYAELGDMQSIKWCMRHQRNLAGIKQEYAADPNSPTLVYLVQDFVNNAQETKDHNDDPESMKYIEATSIYNNEIRQFIDFAVKVVQSKQSKVPCMWQSAAGLLSYMTGNGPQAEQMLDQAMTMQGTQRMRDNARACRLLVHVANARQYSPQFGSWVKQELQWLMAQAENEEGTPADNHYAEVLERVTFSALAPKYRQWGRPGAAMSLLALPNKFENALWQRCAYNPYADDGDVEFHSDYSQALDSLTAQQAIDYLAYTESRPGDELERWLLEYNGTSLDKTKMTDMIGTKYMREGQWAKAVPYLEQVPLSYISKQAISRYMARRDYRVERWFKHQVVDREDDYEDWSTPTVVSHNQKLDFCHSVVALERQLRAASGAEQQARLHYELATLLYQASYKGDCWYLTRYGQSFYDTMCYTGEADLIQQSIAHLRAAKSEGSLAMQEKCLYALAFIPQGADLFDTYYDSRYVAHKRLNRASPRYVEMANLSNFYNMHHTRVSPYVAHCDVLKQFRQLNTPGKPHKKNGTSPRRRRRG